ncbi:MAG: hypothetical protein AVDCRST_MAG03-2106 [uncultured Rubrobacteraceae bacterium]|uniref:Uncharacterized protein n=1 Tax=uncultured Rubrobacteraceae bacterium TaxID=349277 RepID=A0A6J4PH57_9ACTN|nr:MAG: hypothetical protein AVDCRST_MAG03-2106 [uncultured Rubrobacteraceae bacterium]
MVGTISRSGIGAGFILLLRSISTWQMGCMTLAEISETARERGR